MTIGEKIKKQRRLLGYTQSDVAADFISRNMLSLIESGNASPSLETLRYLADALHIPIEYLVSDQEDISPFLRMKKEAELHECFVLGKYEKVLELVDSFGQNDDLTLILAAEASYRFAKKKLSSGSLESAKKYLARTLDYLSVSKFDSALLRAKCALASSIAENIQSPKLNFDREAYLNLIREDTEEEFFHYYCLDFSYPYQNEILSLHIKAKELMRKRDYHGAIALLCEAEDKKTQENYDAFVFLGIYNDLESSYKALADFEKAYRYSTKRISMMEYFKT